MAEMTPMMQQYFEIKRENPDCILFFRLGDFYEMFDEDARLAARELDLALTSRDKSREKSDEERIPMCGVPYHACDGYIARLVSHGHKVAICEQMEDPALAKGLVRRDITRIITPGTVTESMMLEEGRNNYFACIYGDGQVDGLAFCDISTGSFSATCVNVAGSSADAVSALAGFRPAEILLGGAAAKDGALCTVAEERLGCCMNVGAPEEFDYDLSLRALNEQFGEKTGLPENAPAALVRACGALLIRLHKTHSGNLSHIRSLNCFETETFMTINPTARRNLELTETMRTGEKRGTLLWVLDQTGTPMGSRLLRSFLERPLLRLQTIRDRLDAVEELLHETVLRSELSSLLRGIPDFERAEARIVTGTASCRDMLSLAGGAEALPTLRELLAPVKSPLLRKKCEEADDLSDLRETIVRAIREDAPLTLREGGIIKDGYNEELDRLRSVQRDSAEMIAALEAREKERTGIKTLRIRYNRTFGYAIEVSRGQADAVPPDYVRKQTLVNGERFITQELKELESAILTAKDRIAALEYDLFTEIRLQLAAASRRILNTAAAVAYVDVLNAFAENAAKNRYCRPEVDDSDVLELRDCRHPVVEKMLSGAPFVPNDVTLGTEDCRALIITGPNMAGKSTFMRQVALCVILAQIGSFVPAKSAHIGLVDRLFTRVGASDDLAAGQSTFMVEMSEVAEILSEATPRSLIVLDEIGRGTSTFDGMAIARAVLEYCADRRRLGAKTLFATHYHELTDMAQTCPGVVNCSVSVKKRGGQMVFLRKIVPGPAGASYGVEVAGLAGLPDEVLSRSRELLRELEAGAFESVRRPQDEEPLMLYTSGMYELQRELHELIPETLSPLEALNYLYNLKKLVDGTE